MRLFTLSLFIIVVISMLGCSAENPICSTNFCAVGEVFPRSELEDGQTFSEVDIDDSVIFATLVAGTTPVETTPIDSITLADIVADAAAGNKSYVGKVVTIKASVDSDTSEFTNNDAITLITNNEDVVFYVGSRETPQHLANYEKGKSYTFSLFIRAVDPPEEFFPEYAIWSNIPSETISTTINAIVSDVAGGGRTYIDKIVLITATVKSDTSTFFDEDDDYEAITLITNNESVIFFVYNEHDPPAALNQYKEGEAYNFKLFIYNISDVITDKKTIVSHIILD